MQFSVFENQIGQSKEVLVLSVILSMIDNQGLTFNVNEISRRALNETSMFDIIVNPYMDNYDKYDFPLMCSLW